MDLVQAEELSYDLDLGLKVEILEGNLAANLIAKPSWLVGKEINLLDITLTLEKYNLNQDRVNIKEMGSIVNHINSVLNSKKNLVQDLVFPIASGVPPTIGHDGWIKFNFPKSQRVKIREDGSADYRNIDKYIHVKKNDKLAIVFEGLSGKSGIDVFGRPIPPKPITRASIKIGNNIFQEQEANPDLPLTSINVYYSSVNGVIFSTDNSISVSPELIIESDVGLETGNINYDGSVDVHGNIMEGSQVVCKGSLSVSGNIESMNVVVLENLVAKGGVKGKDKTKGLIRVLGDFTSKFIENANLEVEGDIIIENSILNSNIKCLGSIFLGSDSSSIVASDIITFKGISTANLGSSAELDSKLEVGFHFKNNRLYQELKRKLEQLDKDTKEMEPKILKIKHIVQRSRGKLEENQKKEFKAIYEDYSNKKKAIELFIQKIESLKQSRFNDEHVKVVVRNLAFPGSIIRYRKQIEKFTIKQTSFMMSFFPNQEKAIPVAWKKESK